MTCAEADVIMIQQVAKVANDGVESIKVFCDDTGVFILVVYHFTELQLQHSLTMESTSSGRVMIDIGATARKHEGIVRQPPAAHTLSPEAIQLCSCGAEGKALI